MKGIILAGGSGTRLYPITKGVSKQLLPVYDKPMIYYPLSVLMLAGIKDILIISTEEDLPRFENLLGDGSAIGIQIEYKVQPSPDGIAQAFILGKEFIGSDPVVLVLGDNIFYGQGITDYLEKAIFDVLHHNCATVFGYHVKNPSRYGVVEFNNSGKVLSIEEKPTNPKSNYAVTGLYFYPNDVINNAFKLKPSDRGELEITDLIEIYLKKDKLGLQILDKTIEWYDTGNAKSLLEASSKVKNFEDLQKQKLGSYEIACFEMGFITKDQLLLISQKYNKSDYGQSIHQYLKTI